jgi:RNA recognition motif-containing protein
MNPFFETFSYLNPFHRDEEVRSLFESFGQIVHYSRPMKLDKHVPSSFAFIKYETEENARSAIDGLHENYVWDTTITVEEANMQASFFSKNTGTLF